MLRRTFLQTAGGAAAATASAAPAARIKLGIDAYSIRDWRWRALDLLNYAGHLKLDIIQLSSLDNYESLDAAHLQKVREDAERRGIEIEAGIGCICPTSSAWNPATGDAVQYVLKGLSVARAVGSKAMRCFLGSGADRRGKLPIEAHIEATVKVLRAVRSQALDAGVKIAIENHSDMQAWELRTLIEEAGRDFVGCCLDLGNPMAVVENPMVTLETLAPYVVTTHFRDSVVYEHPRGAAFQWVALGDGSLDLRVLVARFRELCPEAAMQLEIITGRPPQVLPYFEEEFWKAFPKARAGEFARFVALAKAGHPFMGAMVIAGPGRQTPEIQAALKQQQRRDLERSLEYARKALGAGVRG
ncbi:MAG TPA: sugar phosphate isomerase/epimerase [Bryobacteraceae bacterium]|nr:sugar phosphate isomerase/epimerase [Bryobacteraceae bacterium]HOL72701.1 sugar phosphate isomerase/epimerase [Bryobacteraceae bacterium]HOQ46835.1 sugar phosphate isomerase/epimerase [Bryobacteraceae bacterium]HPQ15543.1 sugar phosphate isomerase/epimerase [Bryobacteraceae bacterium]HPU73625.1 sugar phosphate isomerase/epimerase [Bryobacteraceae bacterium]